MARFQNKKNGRIATVIDEDRKYKTLLIQYEDDDSEQQISASTLKRWWTELEDDEDEEVEDDEYDEDEVEDDEEYEQDDDEDDDEEEQDDDEDDDEEEQDDDEVEDDDGEEDDTDEDGDDEEEPEESAPKKKAQAKRPKSSTQPKKERRKAEPNPAIEQMVEYVESVVTKQGGEIFIPASQASTRAFKIGGHMYARLLSTRSAVTLACREVVGDEIAEPTKKINHMFANLYVYESMNAADKKLVEKLLQASFKYQQGKNDNPGKKTASAGKKRKGGK